VIPSSTQFLLLTGLNQCAFTVSTGEFFNRIGRLCCKSRFALMIKNSAGCRRGFPPC
jgi:hypothetical protein